MTSSAAPVEEAAFPGQLDGETVLLLATRHPLYYLKTIPFTLIALPVAAAMLAWLIVDAPARQEPWTWWFTLPGGLAVAAIFWAWAMREEWKNDLYIVTDRRVISLRRIYRVFEQRKEIELSRIQDVTVVVDGVLAYLFRFGDVRVASAGASGGLQLEGIGQPEAVKETIFDAGHVWREASYAEEQRLMRQRLAAELERRGTGYR